MKSEEIKTDTNTNTNTNINSKSNFDIPEDSINFSNKEEETLKYWDEKDAFKTQLEKTKHFPKYTFYDGPPFATGLPHYGHITAGTIKDVVTRYWTQNGKHIERRFGWDCHGLPIECIINEKLGIKTKKDLVEKHGIKKYNEECRKDVMKYSKEWEVYTRRFGRWIDFKNDYKTMDKDFMQSVWWVFKQIFDKGLVYRKSKVMPYSWACNTVLSNFEAGQSYKTVNDPSIYITFPMLDNPNRSFLAWTTTPWTLPSNLGITINPKFEYVLIKDETNDRELILAKSLLEKVAGVLKIEKYTILEKYLGKDLADIQYVPLFDTFEKKYRPQGCYKVLLGDFVTSQDGTGIVHTAPAFGEDDFNVCLNYKIINPDSPLCPIDEDGNFTKDFELTAGMNFKDSDKVIIKHLTEKKRILHQGQYSHSYPMCYRTGKPLMYKAIPSWFINVEAVKKDLVENNKKATWVPKYVQEKRFHNWLEGARDWCISRSRSWGNPIPLWASDDFEEIVCISSVEELCKRAGIDNLDDIHRENIDHITIESTKGKGKLKRIEEVFDCWFESGSMPYAQCGYPHKLSEEEFDKRFPADFIAEGLDQTRGWFYTLNVISTILFNKQPYQNLIVNGLVLDKNGKKMSKKDKNYPDPLEILKTYGADSVRLYLINSQLVKGQSLKFNEKGLKLIVKDIFLPLYNSYKFLIQNIQRYEALTDTVFVHNADIIKSENLNITDKWIIAYYQRLRKFVHTEMSHYRLYTVVSELLVFLEKLSNWYIRLNRTRVKGDLGTQESEISLNVLFFVTLHLNILLAPFIPFLTEYIYQNLKKGLNNNPEDSIHYIQIPPADESLINEDIETVINNMITVINQGRYIRENKGILVKKPVAKIQVINFEKKFLENVKEVENYIIEELNTNEMEYINEEEKYLTISAKPNFDVLYKKSKDVKDTMNDEENEVELEKLKKEEKAAKDEANAVANIVRKLNTEEIKKIITLGSIEVEKTLITKELILVEKKFLKSFEKDKEFHNNANSECGMRISTLVNDTIMNAFYARDLQNKIQKLRKESGIRINHDIHIQIVLDEEKNKKLVAVYKEHEEAVLKVVKASLSRKEAGEGYIQHTEATYEIAEEKVTIRIYKK